MYQTLVVFFDVPEPNTLKILLWPWKLKSQNITEQYASAHIILDSKTFLGYEWLMDNYETLTLCVYVSNFHCHS